MRKHHVRSWLHHINNWHHLTEITVFVCTHAHFVTFLILIDTDFIRTSSPKVDQSPVLARQKDLSEVLVKVKVRPEIVMVSVTVDSPKASRASKVAGSLIFNERLWRRASGTSAAASSAMPATRVSIWGWTELNLMQMSSNDPEAAASSRSGCDCLSTAWKVPGKHKFFLILHNWRETNNCGLVFPGAAWCVSVLFTVT